MHTIEFMVSPISTRLDAKTRPCHSVTATQSNRQALLSPALANTSMLLCFRSFRPTLCRRSPRPISVSAWLCHPSTALSSSSCEISTLSSLVPLLCKGPGLLTYRSCGKFSKTSWAAHSSSPSACTQHHLEIKHDGQFCDFTA